MWKRSEKPNENKMKTSRKAHNEKPIFEYSKINNYIYIGTNQCCALHFKNSLIKKGIKADVSLEKEKLDKPFGVDYFLWLPVEDHKAPTFKQLFLGANFVKNSIKNRIKVYVHCKNGHGRSPTLAAAYFILDGRKMEKAIEFIKKKRPSIHLSRTQLEALKDFERRIK